MSKTRNIYNHTKIEKKWQQEWLDSGIYSPDIKSSKNPFFNLMMFPYPSAEGLHVGNMYAFTGADVYGRFNRMQGKDVFEPIGLDGFGIHSENYAIKVGRHPQEHARVSEENFYRQLSSIGNGFAWDHRLETYDPVYYKWTQWLFIQMFNAGLAYKSAAMVNWCPGCKTVLADEQVIDGKCERSNDEVERREMSSWFFRITHYADKLLTNIDDINWPEKIKIAQRQWIGKKTGINISYKIKDTNELITVFTTRPDTNFGATFIVIAPELAKILLETMPDENKETVSKYIEMSLNKSEQQRQEEGKKKTGAFTGLYAINNLNGYEMPIWVSDFVLAGFGTGAVVGVPGHDTRDFEFAQAFDLPIKRVVVASDGDESPITSSEQVQEDEGSMINSDFLDGLSIHEATKKMMDYLEEKGWGERTQSYHLRDWLISRQRYWGPPIPMIYCEACAKANKGAREDLPGWYPESESNLPVLLPEIADFKPKGDGTSPLANASHEWQQVACPGCGAMARRELDVSDTFLDSAWYFLAYPHIKNGTWTDNANPFDPEIIKRWLPVNAYIGGAEHAVLHLLYARFVWMVLCDLKVLDASVVGKEPFPFLFSHGLIIKDGAKMSKSKGNVVVPDQYIEKFGADTLRTYLMFLGPYNSGGDFRDTGIEGMSRFIRRVWDLYHGENVEKAADQVVAKRHQTIKKVYQDISDFKYNTAIAAIMEYINVLKEYKPTTTDLEVLAQLLAPFAPHMAEEVWSTILGKDSSVHMSQWPAYDDSYLAEDTVTIAVQVNGKVRATLTVSHEQKDDKETILTMAKDDEKISKWIEGEQLVNEVYIPGKVVNFVTK